MSSLNITPTREEFRELAKRGNLIPLIVDLVADVETPVSAFAKIDNGQPCFLFESAERNEESGRFSFIGFDPLVLLNSADCKGDPLSALMFLTLSAALSVISATTSSVFLNRPCKFIRATISKSRR
jgi:anthranilate/para-aminobenzoate synthase component I